MTWSGKCYSNWSVITNIYYSIEAFYELFNTKNLEEVAGSFLENMFGAMPLSFSGKVRSLFDMLKPVNFFLETRNLNLRKQI